MGINVTTINPERYGRLCAKALPKIIKTRGEFDRMVEELEALDRKENPTPEDETLAELLMKLIQDYDDSTVPDPDVPPHKMIQFFLDQRKLKQADLVPVIGSRGQVSAIVNGTRGVSKEQAKKLAQFFHTSPALFI
jgi:HTH-type transcriptional regulator / antitoxin HigA